MPLPTLILPSKDDRLLSKAYPVIGFVTLTSCVAGKLETVTAPLIVCVAGKLETYIDVGWLETLTLPSTVCAAGKLKCIKKHHGEDFKDILLGWPKWVCADANKILIDDDSKKGKKFEEYGGHWFEWPHPLKIIDGDLKIDDVLNDLRDFIKEVKNG